MQEKTSKEVVIVQDRIPHYRVGFFNELRRLLAQEGVLLRVLHSFPSQREGYATAEGFYTGLEWAEQFRKLELPFRASWYPILTKLVHADLVVAEAASRRLLNYVLLAVRSAGGPRLALWGHGWSHKTPKRHKVSERVKLWLGKRADWYFAYTWSVRQGLIDLGYEPTRVTDVQNTIPKEDSRSRPTDPSEVKRSLAMDPGATVVVFCGRMYPEKRLDFLLEATQLVKKENPDLVLALVGGGPDEAIAKNAAARNDYIRYLGPLFGESKAELFRIARLVVMPGLVGLGVVDAFHHGVPPVATMYPFHSPEFAYLIDGENGLAAGDSVIEFAAAINRVIQDDELHATLVAGCNLTSSRLTIEEMASRFANGLLGALSD